MNPSAFGRRIGVSLLFTAPVVLAADEATWLEEVSVEAEGSNAHGGSEPGAGTPGEMLTEQVGGIGVLGETMRTMPGAGGDPIRAMQALPGMIYSDDSEAEPAVRGSRPDENTVEIDGVPTGDLFHAFGMISVVNAELVESFSVYPSAYSPEYAGVTGAAIDVRLKDPATDRIQGTIDASMMHAGGLIQGPVNDSQSFYLAGRLSYIDLLMADQFEDGNDDEGIEITQFPKYNDYQAKYLWQLSPDSVVRLQASGTKDDYEMRIDPDAEEVEEEPLFAGRHLQDTSAHLQSLSWEQTDTSGRRLQARLSHSQDHTRFQAGEAGQMDNLSDAWRVRLRASQPWGESHEISAGVEVARENVDIHVEFHDPGCTEFEPECKISTAERLEQSNKLSLTRTHAFVRDRWYLGDRLTLSPGVVFLSDRFLGRQVAEPRFSLEYAATDQHTVHMGAGIHHGVPDYGQIDEVFGNPELDFTRSTHFALGMDSELSDSLQLRSEVFYKKSTDLVTGHETTRYANDGEGTAYGLDLLLRGKYDDRLSGWLALSLSSADRKNTRTGETFDFEYDQPVNLSAVLKYKLNDRWDFGAKLWVHSGAVYTPVVGATPSETVAGEYDPIYGALNSERFPTYTRLDLRVDRRLSPTSSAYLDLINILNSKNISEYEYNKDYTERTAANQLPFIFSIGFRKDF